jgi:DNA polymerase I
MSKTFLILDCHWLCYRAKYSMKDLSIESIPTGVVYGFLKDLITFSEMFHSTNFIFCWDSKYSKRQEIYPAYKQNRRDKEKTEEEQLYDIEFRKQIKKLRKIYLPKIGCSNIFQQKGYEADDIIASVCISIENKNDRGIIISADHDLYQCISPNISFYSPQKKEMITKAKFEKEYGLIPQQWITVKCLAGCNTDNVKGIKGIGEKYAIKYIIGEMKETTATYQKIRKLYSKYLLVNYPLVSLPYTGTKHFTIQPNNFSNNEWRSVGVKLGMKSIEKRNPFNAK